MNALLPLSLDQAATYQIEVQGRLDTTYAEWLGQTTVAVTEGESLVTTVTARVADQAELHGLLQNLYSLGLPLLSLARLE
jgi:hypothetical protein